AHQRFGMFLTSRERFDEAIIEFERARELDPLSLITKTISGYPFYYSRQFEKAAEHFAEVIAMDENYSVAHFRLGLTYAQLGEFEKAIIELEKSTRLSGDRDVVAALGYVHGLTGNSAEAKIALDELNERGKKGFVSAYDKVIVYAGTGDAENALDWLEKAYEERSYWLIYLKSDPSLDSLRTNPRFIALQEKIFATENAETVETLRSFNESRQIVSAEKRFFGWNPWYLAAFGLLLLTVFGLTQFDWRGKNNAVQVMRTANISFKRLTPDINAVEPTISPDGKYLVYAQKEDNKSSIWLKDIATGSAKQIMPPIAEGYEGIQFSPDGSQIYYATSRKNVPNRVIARVSLTGATSQQIVQNVMSPFTISPDGKQVAFVRDQKLIIANTDESGERVLTERDNKTKWFESWGSQLSWSPDGKTIAICGGRIENGQRQVELTEISASDAGERQIPVPNWNYLDDVQWIPDRSGLIVIAKETSGSPLQIWRVAYPSGEATRITQDFQDYHSVSISADSRLMIANQEIGNRNIWTAPLADAKQSRQLTFGTAANDGYWGISLMPDGRIVYTSPRSSNWDLWIMNADGSNQKQLTANAGANVRPSSAPDGRYIFFNSDRNSTSRIWRIDADGGNPKQLTDGEGYQERPIVSPDGKWVYFTWANGLEGSIWKVPSDGGEPVRITAWDNVSLYSVSPDGKRLVFQQYDKDLPNPWQLGLMQTETGEIVKMFDQLMAGRMSWTADSKTVIYIEAQKSVNLWQQPIDGGTPKQLTNFDTEQLRNFDISVDGKTLVVSRGNSSHEVVLIENF
ncbi:MAG: DPP IV N-terminal domain-containing protein, partial [Actinomycetota bacterium]